MSACVQRIIYWRRLNTSLAQRQHSLTVDRSGQKVVVRTMGNKRRYIVIDTFAWRTKDGERPICLLACLLSGLLAGWLAGGNSRLKQNAFRPSRSLQCRYLSSCCCCRAQSSTRAGLDKLHPQDSFKANLALSKLGATESFECKRERERSGPLALQSGRAACSPDSTRRATR